MVENSIESQLEQIDRKLPLLHKEKRWISVVVGKGTCGLGRYNGPVQQSVTQSSMRDWLVDAEVRAAKKGRNLQAIAEAQHNAMLLQRMAREDAVFAQQEARRREKAAEKRNKELEARQAVEEKVKEQQDRKDLAEYQRAILAEQREREEAEVLYQKEVEEELRLTFEYERDLEQEATYLKKRRLHESVQASRDAAREAVRQRHEQKRAAAVALSKGMRGLADRASKRVESERKFQHDEAVRARQEHKEKLAENEYLEDERIEQRRKAVQTILHKDEILERAASVFEKRQKHVVDQRDKKNLIRSVSAML